MAGEVSLYRSVYNHLKSVVDGVEFALVDHQAGNILVGPGAAVPGSLLLNEVGADWGADVRVRNTYRRQREVRYRMILEFDTWVDLEELHAALEEMPGIFINGTAENGGANWFVLVQSSTVEHPKLEEATSGTRVTYELLAAPQLA